MLGFKLGHISGFRPVSIVYNVPEISKDAEIAGSGLVQREFNNLNLSRENLVGIFNGTIKYWNDSLLVADNEGLANVSKRILVVVRKDSAGTTSIFTRALSAFTLNWPNRFESFGDGM